ncbi:MAG: hypothetical protein RL497_128 [Pseudomonadota bacterium]
MKIGRNDPCHCGSGKKYKHCCLEGASKQHGEILDEFAQSIAMNPHLNLDELNVLMAHKMTERNNRPIADFCGLSATQMSNWLSAPFDELLWVTINTPTDLSACPVMRYLDLIVREAIQQGGSIKATTKGNLPVKLVKQASALLPEFAIALYEQDISISDYAGNNEDNFRALHYTRVLAEVTGILTLKSGRFWLSQSAQEQYLAGGINGFFLLILEAAVGKFNWAYLDSWENGIDLRTFWLFMLWRVHSHGSLIKMFKEVAIAFPDLLVTLSAAGEHKPDWLLPIIINVRFVDRFLQYWGFVIHDPRGRHLATDATEKTQVLPLLKQTFIFSI